MKQIGGSLEKYKNIILKGFDPVSSAGFTQVPNHILRAKNLSAGAKITYSMLLSYAWQNDYCFPGQKQLVEDIGAAERSVRTYLNELETAGYLEVKQRGLGQTNLYYLNVTVSASK